MTHTADIKAGTSSRAGFLPVSLEHLPVESLRGMDTYIRIRPETLNLGSGPAIEGYRLYCSGDIRFTEFHRQRLIEHGLRFIYLRIADQSRFRKQVAEKLDQVAASGAAPEAATIIYETSIELMNELLADPETLANSPKLEQLSRGVTTFALKNPAAFEHLFAASHHDFYTATHMVNVATWMVPLAVELGITDQDELNLICRAGLVHDMGKIGVPEEVLNKSGRLTDDEWQIIRAHPQAGYEYLKKFDGLDEKILRVTLEHHERMDGTGYPHALTAEKIHLYSRICAVVDSFDAMTAFRPFKKHTMGVGEAMAIMEKEAGTKYDAEVMAAWSRLVAPAAKDAPQPTGHDLRRHPRTTFHCRAKLHALVTEGDAVCELPGFAVTAHSISRSGLGFISPTPLRPGQAVRVYVQAAGWQKRPLEGEVVRCREQGDKHHECGMKFIQVNAAAA
ncbi:MAG TPA: HD domain-containing phosphohydrolase [Phycisphaerales bacterium]|nr:HD domain-containing phosphohydrolase [Phycisphaerales bacterium]